MIPVKDSRHKVKQTIIFSGKFYAASFFIVLARKVTGNVPDMEKPCYFVHGSPVVIQVAGFCFVYIQRLCKNRCYYISLQGKP